MNWLMIKNALYAAAKKTNSAMTIRHYEEFAKEVKFQLSHNYEGEGNECTVCKEDFDYEFHLD